MLTGHDPGIAPRFLQGQYQIVLTSYIVVEVLRTLKRLANSLATPYVELESLFWDFCSHESILKLFKQPFAEALIAETKRLPEYRIIARLLDLEVKDVPYIVTAFEYKAILVSDDIRSLVNKRDKIRAGLDVVIMSSKEFLRT